jgi:hypothetical protein
VYKGSRAQEVTLGAKNSNFVVVSGGLAAGDKIALRDPNAALTTQQGQEKKL